MARTAVIQNRLILPILNSYIRPEVVAYRYIGASLFTPTSPSSGPAIPARLETALVDDDLDVVRIVEVKIG